MGWEVGAREEKKREGREGKPKKGPGREPREEPRGREREGVAKVAGFYRK